GAPLIDDDDNTLGTVCVVDTETHEWGRPGLEVIKGMAEKVMDRIRERKRSGEVGAVKRRRLAPPPRCRAVDGHRLADPSRGAYPIAMGSPQTIRSDHCPLARPSASSARRSRWMSEVPAGAKMWKASLRYRSTGRSVE